MLILLHSKNGFVLCMYFIYKVLGSITICTPKSYISSQTKKVSSYSIENKIYQNINKKYVVQHDKE